MIPKRAIHWQGLVQADAQENMLAARAQNPGMLQPTTAVPALKLYYQRTKIQPAAGDGRSSAKVVLPENDNPQPAAGDGRSSTKVVLPENETVDACQGYRSSCLGSTAGNSKKPWGRPANACQGYRVMVRKYAANPKQQGDAILERVLATRDA